MWSAPRTDTKVPPSPLWEEGRANITEAYRAGVSAGRMRVLDGQRAILPAPLIRRHFSSLAALRAKWPFSHRGRVAPYSASASLSREVGSITAGPEMASALTGEGAAQKTPRDRSPSRRAMTAMRMPSSR